MNEEWAKRQRDLSDAELVKGGAEVVKGEDGKERLGATKEQIEKAKEEMNDFLKKTERMKEITRGFVAEGYAWELANNEEPENYVYQGRRVLRSTIQTIVENLLKTGEVEKKKDGFKGSQATGMFELETQNPAYKEFVYSLNKIMLEYGKLFDGSTEIRNAGYRRMENQKKE
jgi:hypothetical protein